MAEEANKKDRGKWFREMKSELKKVVWPDRQDDGEEHRHGDPVLSGHRRVHLGVRRSGRAGREDPGQPVRSLRSGAWLITQSGM